MIGLRHVFLRKVRRDFLAAKERASAPRPDSDSIVASRHLSQLQTTWSDCVSNIPYYQQLVAHGSAPSRLSSISEFRSIPVLTRRTFQEKPEMFMRRNSEPPGFFTTAGSTGTPLRVGASREERDLMRIV